MNNATSGTYQGNTISGNTTYGFYYSGTTPLLAINNNWGDLSGPLDDSDDRASGGLYNPNGKGNKVSDHVNYAPWTGSTDTTTATPSGLTATSAWNGTAALSWAANTEPSLGGYKIYTGTTSGAYGTPTLVDKVTTATLTGLSNNTKYFVSIASMNAVGVESVKSAEIVVTPQADLTPPTAPLVGGASVTKDTTPTWSWSSGGNGGNGTFRYKVNNTDLTTQATATTTPAFTPATPLSEGTQTLYVQERDAAGNWSASGSFAIVVDTTAPGAVSAGGNKTANAMLTQTGTATDASAMTFVWTKQSGPGAINFETANSSATAISANVDGTYIIRLTATDLAGNSAFSEMVLVWDTSSPSVTDFALPATGNSARVTFTTLTATDNVAVIHWCITATNSSAGCVWGDSKPIGHTFTGILPGTPTQKTLYAWAKDAAGNVSASAATSITLVIGAVATIPMPDTGQTRCYDDVQEITCPQPGEPFYGQDAQYVINARSYTKLGVNDVILPDNATVVDGWIATKDNITGLIWEMKTDDGSIHDKDNMYTWCDNDPATNSGGIGTCGNGTDSEDFLQAVNTANYGGHNDWRMPTMHELASLVDSSMDQPGLSINTVFFPFTQPDTYWSSTSFITHASAARLMHFGFGADWDDEKDGSHYVRAVRGGRYGVMDHLVDNGDGTVTDTSTCLTWQQATAPSVYNWREALAYAEDLALASHEDWRLPSVNELRTLVDYDQADPSIDIVIFPDTNSDFGYWSSTTDANSDGDQAQPLSFANGLVSSDDKLESFYVRAVRGVGCEPAKASAVPTLIVPGNDADGNYTVEWEASATQGVTYFLWEATDSNFTTGVRQVYSGTETSVNITGRASGKTYYYSVNATKPDKARGRSTDHHHGPGQ